jgi:hypothetical protein
MKITKKIASRISLYDDATPTGGKSHNDEHLDEFMESTMGLLPFGSSLTKVNEALKECGIMPVTEEEVLEVSNVVPKEAAVIFEKIARRSKMDCWFGIDDKGRVYDREGQVKGKSATAQRILIRQLMEGMTQETFNELTDKEKTSLVLGLADCLTI